MIYKIKRFSKKKPSKSSTKKVHISQTTNIKISKGECFDWKNCDENGYVPIKSRKNQ